MKRKILILLAVLTVMFAVPAVANAQIIDSGECGANGDNVTWTLDDVSKPFTGNAASVTPDTTGAAKIKFFVWTNNIQPVTNVEVMDL